jgi:hypothetical protein
MMPDGRKPSQDISRQWPNRDMREGGNTARPPRQRLRRPGETKRVLICYDPILAAGLLITVVDDENSHLTSSILAAPAAPALTSFPESREKNRLDPKIAGLITNNARQLLLLFFASPHPSLPRMRQSEGWGRSPRQSDRRRFDAGKNGGGILCSFGSFPVILVRECQTSRRWHYRRKPAHLDERRNPKHRDDIIDIAYLSINNA